VQLQVLERDEEQAAETAPPFPAPSAVPDPGRHSLVFKLAVVLAFVVGGAFYVLLLYAASIHAAPGNSDGATVILEGRALSAGNLTLKHWALSMDSFWLVDVPLYAIGVLLVGVRPELLHLVPSIVAFAVISVGAWIARFGRRGWAAALAVGALVVLLGLPNRALAANFLMGPLHVTTVLWCLGAFVALRNGRYGWGWLLGVGLLAVGLLGDMQAAMLGTIPVFLAGLAGALRKRDMRVGLPAASAAIASAIAAEVLRHLALAIGTFSIARANPRAPVNQMIVNLRGLLGYGAALAGVGIKPFSSASEPAILFIAHAIGLVVLVVAVCLAAVAVLRASAVGLRASATRFHARALGRSRVVVRTVVQLESYGAGTWFEDVLIFAFLGACAIYVSLTLVSSDVYDRYLTAVLIYGSILAARLIGRVVERAETARRTVALTVFASLVAAAYVATFAGGLGTPAPVPASTALVSYLETHDLTSGIGDYWSSSIVTVESSDAVVIRPVTTEPGTRYLGRYVRQTSSAWYRNGFEFFVYNTALPWNAVDAQTAALSFGPPRQVASVGTYRVLSWGHRISVPGDGSYVRFALAPKG